MPELNLEWLRHPGDPLAPRAMTEDIRQVVAREILEQIGGNSLLTEEQFSEMMEELSSNPTVMAMVEAESLRRAAQVHELAEKSIEAQAVQAVQSGFHGYHPSAFRDPEDMLEDAFQGTKYGSTEWYNLRTILRLIVPHCKRRGIPIPDNLLEEGIKSKARYMADYLGKLYGRYGVTEKAPDGELPDEVYAETEAMLAQVVDRDVTLSALKQRFQPTPASGLARMQGWHYLEKNGGYFVVRYEGEAQRVLIERQLQGRVDWALGEGGEPFLESLLRRRSRGSGA